MKKLSIGFRLTLWYLAIFALAQTVFGVGMWVILRHHLYDLVENSLSGQVEDLGNFLEAQKKNASIAKLQEEVSEAYLLEHSGDYLELFADNDQLLYRSTFLQNHPVQMAGGPGDKVFRNLVLGGNPFCFTVQRLSANGHVFTVSMGVPTVDVVETLNVFRSYLLMFAPLLFLAAAGGGYWLSRRALSPVDDLVRTARGIGGANLSGRLQKVETGDELQRLSDTLNEMLDRIETAFLRVTEFTADASHELRTPISLIRTEAELALRRSRGEAEYKEALRHILLEAERTTFLIEQLLALARADSGRESLHMQPVNFPRTLAGLVEGWQHVAAIRNLRFSAELATADSFVMGDEASLRRVADILLDNAFKYTPSPGSVRLAYEVREEKATVIVEDSGVGIESGEQEKIFERFYRVDKARSRAQGGAGLGLAIALWIVSHHRGTISVVSRNGCGATFKVELPTIPAPIHSPQLA